MKEGIKYSRTFILFVSLHMTGAFCKRVSQKMTHMELLLPPYFLAGSDYGQCHYDSNAFLFSLVNKPGWEPVKLPQTGIYSYKRQNSICQSTSFGPAFGGGYDIYISNSTSPDRNSYSDLGYTYSPPSGYSYGSTFAKTFPARTFKLTPDEVETFYETT